MILPADCSVAYRLYVNWLVLAYHECFPWRKALNKNQSKGVNHCMVHPIPPEGITHSLTKLRKEHINGIGAYTVAFKQAA